MFMSMWVHPSLQLPNPSLPQAWKVPLVKRTFASADETHVRVWGPVQQTGLRPCIGFVSSCRSQPKHLVSRWVLVPGWGHRQIPVPLQSAAAVPHVATGHVDFNEAPPVWLGGSRGL